MARYLDGSGDYLGTSTAVAALNGAQVTLAIWFRLPASATQSQYDRLIELGGYVSGQGGIGLEFDTSGSNTKIDCRIWTDGSGGNTDIGTADIPTDLWCLALVTSDAAADSSFYINTSLVGTGTVARLTNAATICIGAQNASRGSNQGEFDVGSVAVWSSILSASDIEALARGDDPSTVSSGSLVRAWLMAGDSSPEPEVGANEGLAISGDCTQVAHVAPTNGRVAMMADGNVLVAWDGEGPMQVERKPSGGSYSVLTSGTLGNGDFFVDTSPLAGDAVYRVVAASGGSYSNEATYSPSTVPWDADTTLELCLLGDEVGSLTNGTTLATAHDLSGKFNHVRYRGAPAARPSGTVGLGGIPAIQLDGASDYFDGGGQVDLAGKAGFTLMALVEPDSADGWSALMARESTSAHGWLLGYDTNGLVDLRANYNTVSGFSVEWLGASGANAIDAHGMPAVITGIYDGAGGLMEVWVNGISVPMSSVTGTIPSTLAKSGAPLRIGNDGNGNLFKGYLAAALVFSSALDATTRASYEQALIEKAGLYVLEETGDSGTLTLGAGMEVQGLCVNGAYAYVTGTSFLSKRLLSDWSEAAANSDPWSGLSGYDHLADCAFYSGSIYTIMSGTSNTLVALFDATTLGRTTTYDISAEGVAPAGLAYDPTRGRFWGIDWNATADTIYWWDASGTFNALGGTVTLSQAIPYAQGIAYGPDGYLWVSTGENSSSEAYNGLIYRINPTTGDAQAVYRRANQTSTEGSVGEGLAWSADGNTLYYAVTGASSGKIHIYGVTASDTQVTASATALWNASGYVSKDGPALWDVGGTASVSAAALWDVSEYVQQGGTAEWIVGNAARVATALWGIASGIAKAASALWDVGGAVTKTGTALWGPVPDARGTQTPIEVIYTGPTDVRATAIDGEVLEGYASDARATHLVVELLGDINICPPATTPPEAFAACAPAVNEFASCGPAVNGFHPC